MDWVLGVEPVRRRMGVATIFHGASNELHGEYNEASKGVWPADKSS